MQGNQERLIESVQRLFAALFRFERQLAARQDTSVSQLRILMDLLTAAEHALSVTALANKQGLTASTMTRNLMLLERKGLIEKVKDVADRRCVRVRLTPEGQSLARELGGRLDAGYRAAFAPLHPSERVEHAVAARQMAVAIERVR